MSGQMESGATALFGGELHKVAALLGGELVLHHVPEGQLDAHAMLMQGLPGTALTHLIDSFLVLHKTESLEKVAGISLRTFQRRKDAPEKPLSVEQSGRLWKFAEVLAHATSVFGSQEQAEHWLDSPAIGLDQQRPIDLLATPAGVEMVETYLVRIEYCVYT